MSAKKPQTQRQSTPMPIIEGVAEARKEAETRREKKKPVKTARAINKFGEQLMTAALTTAINTVVPPSAPAVPFEVPSMSADAAEQKSPAAVPPVPDEIHAVAQSIVSRASSTPEPRTI